MRRIIALFACHGLFTNPTAMVQAVTRAFDILEFVANRPGEASTLTEIAEHLGLHQATCANLIRTLAARNYLEQVGPRKGYRLGPMAYRLTNNPEYQEGLIMAARGPMAELTRRVNEGCLLGVLRNHRRFILHSEHADQELQVRGKTERNVFETASGRILIAFLSESERHLLLEKTGLPEPAYWPEVADRQSLEAALEKIRREEFILTRSPKHIVGLAIPIRREGKVVAGLSLFLPESRFRFADQQELVAALRETGRIIEDNLRR
jgi:IclR family KDG regulon transcriptional repressor